MDMRPQAQHLQAPNAKLQPRNLSYPPLSPYHPLRNGDGRSSRGCCKRYRCYRLVHKCCIMVL
jgi:hypothetical protein